MNVVLPVTEGKGVDMINQEDYTFFREHVSFVSELAAGGMLQWAQSVTRVVYEKGTQIRDGEGMLLLKSGIVRFFLRSQEEKELSLYRLRIGEICVTTDVGITQYNSPNLHIEVESACETLRIDSVSITLLCGSTSAARLFFSKLLNNRLFVSTQTMEKALFNSLEQRIALFLLEEPVGGDDSIVMTHTQLAHHIGCAREAATRALDVIGRTGSIDLARGCIHILDRAGLRKLIA
ncbi:hypothetical protein FACS18948_7050 [Clostridia bacterium]|nr:hypothetical protein FACS18948_7050 [Clostridia bacterium]